MNRPGGIYLSAYRLPHLQTIGREKMFWRQGENRNMVAGSRVEKVEKTMVNRVKEKKED